MEPIMDKKLKILASATELFARYGVRNTSVDQIARRAGIGKGTIYYYYPDKMAILRECLTTHIEMQRQEACTLYAGEADVLLRLKKILVFFGEQKQNDPLLSMLLNEYTDFRAPELSDCLQELEKGTVQMVGDLLQEGIEQGQLKEVPLPLTAFLLVRMYYDYRFQYEGDKRPGQFLELVRTFLQ
jgi:AcrR family transcriptional regulator